MNIASFKNELVMHKDKDGIIKSLQCFKWSADIPAKQHLLLSFQYVMTWISSECVTHHHILLLFTSYFYLHLLIF